jgi:glycosyltransferase involved in cell wall biosynthesis
MRFSIITPSYRNSIWLKLAVASVADQNVDLEHIVQDAGSDDGTLDWVIRDSRVKFFVEKDAGMYDAINRGLKKASGEILAHLNCDEQYLPGALKTVAEYFEMYPDTDILFANSVVIDRNGEYVCSREVQIPQSYHTWVVHLGTLTCATFFHRRVVDAGHLFDPSFRYVGDADWILRAKKKGFRMRVLKSFTSVFTETGGNLTIHRAFELERLAFYKSAPAWVLRLRPLWILQHRLRRLLDGVYFLKPHFNYQIYTQKDWVSRREFNVKQPTYRWREWRNEVMES